MIRRSALFMLSIVSVCGLGCAMCCGPDLYTYPTFGGCVERTDPEYGRVGSIYSDPQAVGGTAPSPLQSPPIVKPERATIEPQPNPPPANPQTKTTSNNTRRIRVPQGWR